MQKYSLSVEDLSIGLSELLNTNFEHNVQENHHIQRSGQDVDEVLSCRAETLGVAFNKIKDNSYGARKLQPFKWGILSKDGKMGNPHLRNELSGSFDGKQKEKPEAAKSDFFAQKTPKFLKNITDVQTSTCQQSSKLKTRNDDIKFQRLNDRQSKMDCPTLQDGQVAEKSNADDSVLSIKKTNQIRENAKQSAKFKPKSELLSLTKAADHEKLFHSDQSVTNSNKVRNVPYSRRFSAPFSFRSTSRPGANYKLISTYEDIAQFEKYPDRNKLFSPTPPRKEKAKSNIKELEFGGLRCEQNLRCCKRFDRQQQTLNASPESLGHKEFETKFAINRFFQYLSEGFSKRKSFDAAAVCQRKESNSSTKYVLTTSAPTRTRSKLAGPFLCRERKSESIVARVSNVQFDSPVYEDTRNENLTPLMFPCHAPRRPVQQEDK